MQILDTMSSLLSIYWNIGYIAAVNGAEKHLLHLDKKKRKKKKEKTSAAGRVLKTAGMEVEVMTPHPLLTLQGSGHHLERTCNYGTQNRANLHLDKYVCAPN